MFRSRFTTAAALLVLAGCGDSGTGPADPADGRRLAAQFEGLADQIGDSGTSATADALRHAAQIVRLVGHATPVTVTIDGVGHDWLAAAEQLDFPELQCVWPASGGPGEGDGGTGAGTGDSVVPPTPPDGGEPECTETGTHSMRSFIAWEPEHMAEVVRISAEPGSSEVRSGATDVMAGLPAPTEPGDTAVSGGGGQLGFMGEYLVQDAGSFWTVDGSQSNSLEGAAGACTEDRTTFDWAEFSCEGARLRFEFEMRVEQILGEPLMGRPGPATGEGDAVTHDLSLAAATVDGVRLTVVGWTAPPQPVPGPEPVPGPYPNPGPDPIPVDSTGQTAPN
jgi:hypothetical protein